LLLLLVGIAGLASWLFWPKSAMREKYDRIRLGMPMDEVSRLMGFPQVEGWRAHVYYHWEPVAVESMAGYSLAGDTDGTAEWEEGPVAICVGCRDRKAVMKAMEIAVPPWKDEAREWLDWVRGLVGC
jgi:hypothetical protein